MHPFTHVINLLIYDNNDNNNGTNNTNAIYQCESGNIAWLPVLGGEVLTAKCSALPTEYASFNEIHSDTQRKLNAIIGCVNPYYCSGLCRLAGGREHLSAAAHERTSPPEW
ncbi:hypothetical protein E2C01_081872 [Portunus trituberculatus]|uniref:Uncharacterized protein n=1 Tax=Portunus trituberculatus TaxID=210409 RepID=A0A5B7IXS3_PORTR|nr:hypothetical protein [Portunus trituberculatus]